MNRLLTTLVQVAFGVPALVLLIISVRLLVQELRENGID